MDDALAFAPITKLSDLIRRRELSPVELTDLYLERIELYDPALNAYINPTAERARAQARAAEMQIAAGVYLGPLHGIPIAFKDLVNVAGLPTTGGSILLGDQQSSFWPPTILIRPPTILARPPAIPTRPPTLLVGHQLSLVGSQ